VLLVFCYGSYPGPGCLVSLGCTTAYTDRNTVAGFHSGHKIIGPRSAGRQHARTRIKSRTGLAMGTHGYQRTWDARWSLVLGGAVMKYYD
jgi:hypothetical protein